jgi:hypothetical protein
MVSISTILFSATVKAITAKGCPRIVMTAPAVPLTSAGGPLRRDSHHAGLAGDGSRSAGQGGSARMARAEVGTGHDIGAKYGGEGVEVAGAASCEEASTTAR